MNEHLGIAPVTAMDAMSENTSGARTRAERTIDDTLSESFPASDPPPWTTAAAATSPDAGTIPATSTPPSGSRTSAAVVLEEVLGRTLDLGVRARHARWNVTAVAIRSIHAALGRLAADLDAIGARIAECAARLGTAGSGRAPAVHDFTCGCTTGAEERDCLTTLTGELADLAAITRAAIRDLAASGDPATREILATAARILESWRSYMERHVPEFA